MTEQTWFRIDRKTAKWHVTREIVDGAMSPHVFLAQCGAGLGDSPDREPRALVTSTEPQRERTCAKCLRITDKEA